MFRSIRKLLTSKTRSVRSTSRLRAFFRDVKHFLLMDRIEKMFSGRDKSISLDSLRRLRSKPSLLLLEDRVVPTVQIASAAFTPAHITEGATATLSGTFTDTNSADMPLLTVQWNDGSALQTFSAGTLPAGATLTYDGGTGTGAFSFPHLYNTHPTGTSTAGQFFANVTLFDAAQDLNSQSTPGITVDDAPVTSAATPPQTSAEGVTGPIVVGTFIDGNPTITSAQFHASIDYGDSSPIDTNATFLRISSDSTSSTWEILGTHAYSMISTYSATATIQDDVTPTPPLSLPSVTENVIDAPLRASSAPSIAAVEGATTGPVAVATFTDGNAGDHHGDFTTSINWGDGSPADITTGVVTYNAMTGVYTVTGTHTYAEEGSYPVTVQITDAFGFSVSTGLGLNAAGVVVTAPTDMAGAWSPDRYPPNGFAYSPTETVGGQTGILTESISSADDSANRPSAYSDVFYDFQGRSFDLPAGTQFVGVDLYVPASYQSATLDQTNPTSGRPDRAGSVASVWGTGVDSSGDYQGFNPVIGFNNQAGGTGGFQVFNDEAGGWVNTPGFTGYDQWYHLSFGVVGDKVFYFVNNQLVYTDTTTDGTTSLSNVILQGYNAGNSYDINWGGIGATTAAVADAPLHAGALTPPMATEGASLGPVTVFHFTDDDPGGMVSDYVATVQTGDATLTSSADPGNVAIVPSMGGGFDVQLTYTYAEEFSSATFSVSVADVGGETTSASQTPFSVADAPLTENSFTPPVATAGAPFTGTILNFSDANPNAVASGYAAVVTLGDGNSVTLPGADGSIAAHGDGTFDVNLSYTYAKFLNDATFSVTVYDTSEGRSIADPSDATVSDSTPAFFVSDAPLSAKSVSIEAVEGASTGPVAVATFTDPNPNAVPTDFATSIDWGDNTPADTTGVVSYDAMTGVYTVTGIHTYADESSYPVTVKITDIGGGFSVDTGMGLNSAGAVVTSDTETPGEWYPDRYAPAGFSQVPGGVDESISAADADGSRAAPFNSTFYDFQGRKYDLAAGTTFVGVDLDIPASWQSSNQVDPSNVGRFGYNGSLASLWTTGLDGSGDAASFPIIGFNNSIGMGDGGGFEVFDQTNGWTSVPGFAGYGQTYRLSIGIDGDKLEYFVNGALVYTDAASAGTTSLGNVMLQGYNGGNSYDIKWGGIGASAAAVSDAPLHATAGPAFNAAEGAAVSNVVVATFTDANPGDHTGDFTAAINWGDGTAADVTGVVTYDSTTGVYTVTGSHTYAIEGSYAVTVKITDAGGFSVDTGLGLDSTGAVVTSATESTGVWYPDRFAPAGFTQVPGGVDESISGADMDGEALNSTFYDFQGLKYDLAAETTFVGVDLNIPSSWSSLTQDDPANDGKFGYNGSLASLWTTGLDSGSATSSFPIIGFNNAIVAGGSFEVFDQTNGWTSVPGFAGYDKTYQLSIGINGDSVDYFVNGTLVYTDTTPTGTISLSNVILQGYNGGNNYDINWSNLGATKASVADAALSENSFTPPVATAGAPFSGTIFNFSDANPNAVASEYTAVVTLGDGHSVTLPGANGSIVAHAGGTFDVNLSYTYANSLNNATFAVTVYDTSEGRTITTPGVSTVGDSTSAFFVSDAPLSAKSGSFTAVEGTTTGPVVVATFTDPNPNAVPTDFATSINWGDGTAADTTGVVSYDATTHVYSVTGSHTYADEGSYPVTVKITDVGGGFSVDTGMGLNAMGAVVTSDTETAGAWYPDRFAPAGFTPVSGGVDESIDGANAHGGALNSTFYDFQGRKYDLASGTTFVGVDLDIPSTWQSLDQTDSLNVGKPGYNGSLASLWTTGVGTDNDLNDPTSFPIIGFNNSISMGGGFEVFDQGTGTWKSVGGFTGYDQTYHLSIGVVGDKLEYFVNGNLVYTDTASGGTISLGNVMLQGYNAGNSYDIHWGAIGAGTAQVADAPLHATAGPAFNAVEGAGVSNVVVATFTDANPGDHATDFTTTINWGDGNTTTGVVAYDSTTQVYTVTGSHTYVEEGSYPVTVKITDAGGFSVDTALGLDPTTTGLITTSATDSPGVWYPDRFAPAGFTQVPGGVDESISGADMDGGASNSTFYDFQGRKYDLAAATAFVGVDLNIPSSWSTLNQEDPANDGRFGYNGSLASLWTTGVGADNNPDNPTSFPIIGFNNSIGTGGGGGFEVFDQTNGWTSVPGFAGYGQTYQLSIGLNGDNVDYFVNGTLVYTDTTSTGTTSLGNVMLQGYNGGNDYHIAWSNLGATKASVANAPLTNGTALAVGAVAGQAFNSVPVATFTDSNTFDPTASEIANDQIGLHYQATIDWGDGHTSTGTIVFDSGTFTVLGSHTYTDAGSYATTITVTHDAADPLVITDDNLGMNVKAVTVANSVWVNDNWVDNAHSVPQFGDPVTAPSGESAPNAVTLTYGVNAFSTIQDGIDHVSADGTVYVLTGNYAGQVNVDKTVDLEAEAGASVSAAGASTVFTIAAPNVTINGFAIEVDQRTPSGNRSGADAAIYGDANFDGVTISNNTFTGVTTEMRAVYLIDNTSSQSATLTGNTFNANASDYYYRTVEFFQLENVVVGGPTLADGNSFSAGFAVDLQLNFMAANGTATVENNTFNGGGVNVTEPNSGATVDIEKNTFSPISPAFDAALYLNHNYTGAMIDVADNTFTGIRLGIVSSASSNVTVEGNTITPAMGVAGYSDLLVTTTSLGSSAIGNPANGIVVEGNTFNGNTGATGQGISFQNGNAVNGTAFGPLVVGGAGSLANTFASTLQTFIQLAAAPTDGLLTTPTAPFTQNIDASGNLFDVSGSPALPASMSLTDLYSLEDKIFHKVDDDSVGFVTVKAGNVYVTPNSGSIQRGVDAASANNTIHVEAGTYPLSAPVNVNKAVTLQGANSGIDPNAGTPVAPTIVNGTTTGMSGPQVVDGFDLGANGVTIDGFEVTGAAVGVNVPGTVGGYTLTNNVLVGNSIDVYANAASSSTISHNLFDGTNGIPGPAGPSGIYVDQGTNGLTVDSNTFVNFTGDNPMIFGATPGVSTNVDLHVTNNDLHANTLGIYVLALSGGTFDGNSITTDGAATALSFSGADSNIDVTDNLLTNNLRGIRVVDSGDLGASSAPNSDIRIHGNGIVGIAAGAPSYAIGIQDDGVTPGYTGVLDASGNYFGTSDPTMVQIDTPASIDFTPLLDNNESVANQAVLGFTPDYSSLTVHTLGAETGSVGRIQEGINLVAANGTVNVAVGTYGTVAGGAVSAVDVNKSNIKVLGAAGAIIVGNGTEGPTDALVEVSGNHDTFSGFKIDLSASTDTHDELHPLLVDGSNNTIENNTVLGNGPNGDGLGIWVAGPDSMTSADGNQILNNAVSNFGDTDILIGGDNLASNTTVEGNETSDAYYGIYIDRADGTAIIDNDVHDNQWFGIRIAGELGSESAGTVVDANDIHNNGSGTVPGFDQSVDFGGGIDVQGSSPTIENNFIRNNTLGAGSPGMNPRAGIVVNDDDGGNSVASNPTITFNSFSGNDVAIVNATAAAAATTAGGQAQFFIDNGRTSTGAVDASFNSFGSSDPTAVLAMLPGGGIDFTPFIASSTDTDLATAGFQPDLSNLIVTTDGTQTGSTSRIQESLGAITSPGTIQVTTGVYSETTPISITLDDLTFNVQTGALNTGSVPLKFALAGTAVSITLTGTGAADAVANPSLASTIVGNDGANTLTSGAGDDSLTGGAGIDTAVFHENYANYTISFSGANLIVADNSVADLDGTDTLTGIERLVFADKTVLIVGAGSEYTIAAAEASAHAGDIILIEPPQGIAATTYVNGAWNMNQPGDVVANPDSMDLSHPFLTIGYDAFATVQAGVSAVAMGGTVNVFSGTYDEVVTISQPLTLQQDEADLTLPLVAPTSGSQQVVITVNAANVTINGIAVQVNQNDDASIAGTNPIAPVGIAAIVSGANPNFDGLTIENTNITSIGSDSVKWSASPSLSVVAAGIVLSDSASGTVPFVTLKNNDVSILSGTSFFQRAVWIAQVQADIEGNTFAGAANDLNFQFASQGSSTSLGSKISNNTFAGAQINGGGGVVVGDPNANSPIEISGNTFAPVGNLQPVSLVINQNRNGATSPITVENNTFTGALVGIDAGDQSGLTISGNSFTPAAGASAAFTLQDSPNALDSHTVGPVLQGFVDIHIDSASESTNEDPTIANSATITGNTFRAAAGSTGSAIVIGDDLVGGGSFGGVVIGGTGMGAANTYNAGSGAIVQTGGISTITDTIAGQSTAIAVSGGSATITGSAITANAIGIDVAGGSVSVDGNDFNGATENGIDLKIEATAGAAPIVGGKLTGNTFAGATSIDQLDGQNLTALETDGNTYHGAVDNFAVEDKIHDYLDDPTVGYVSLDSNNVYITPASEAATAGAIQRGITVAVAGNAVNIEAGTYVGNVDATGKTLTLAPGAGPAQVTITGNLTLGASDTLSLELDGTTAATQFDNFVVSGTVALGGATLSPSLDMGFTPANGNAFSIVTNNSGTLTSGTFLGLANGAATTIGGIPFRIFYNFDGTDNVVLIAQTAVSPTPDLVYVNSAWAPGGSNPKNPGDSIGNPDPNVSGEAPAIFGLNAFATLQDAIAQANADGSTSIVILGGTYANDVTMTNPVTLDLHNGPVTISGVITGADALSKTGTSTLVLTADDTLYTGTTTVSQGILQLGASGLAGGTSGLVGGSIVDNADVTFNRSDSPTFAGAISGNGNVTKGGSGTLTLTGTNSYSGGTTVLRGNLFVTNDAELGDASGSVSVTTPGAIEFSGNITSSRIFALNNNSSLQVVSGTLTLKGAEIDGGFLSGPGSIVTMGTTTTFNGSQSRASVSIDATVNTNFTNFTDGGPLELAAGATFSLSSFTVSSSGNLTVDGTANVTDFVSNGNITVDAGPVGGTIGGVINNNGTSGLTFGGGSVTQINGADASDAGSPPANSGRINLGMVDASLAGGLMVNDGKVGSATPGITIDVGFGGLAEGYGHYTVTPNVGIGGHFSTGHSPGTLSVSTYNLNNSSFLFEIADAAGTAGNLNNWDETTVTPDDFVSNPTLNFFGGDTYTVQLASWTSASGDGAALSSADFNEFAPYAWEFVDGSQATSTGNFSGVTFNIDQSQFAVEGDSAKANLGNFSVQFRDTNGDSTADSLFIVYTPKIAGTTVTTSSASTVFGETVTFTATMDPTATGLTGTVDFFDGGTSIGSAPANSSNVATLPVSSLSVGTHNITAVYEGDATHAASTSTAILQSVSTDNSSTGLDGSPEPSDLGETVVLTATVTADAPGSGAPAGTVQFVIDGSPSGTPVAVDGTGKASISISTLPIGPHTINATFTSTDNNFNGSVAVAITQDVNPDPTISGIVLNGDSSYVNSTLATNQHSMVESIVYTFSQAVSLSAADFTLTGINGTTFAPTVNVAAMNGTGRDTVWTVTFSGDGVNLGTHSIGDGEYRLILTGIPGGLTNTYDFFRLLGDIDGNGTVDTADFSCFVATFLRATNDPLYLGAADFDGDHSIGTSDFSEFVSNFLNTLPAPLPPN